MSRPPAFKEGVFKTITDYVSDYFRDNPDVPIIKVIPPQGYRPRNTEYPTDLRIDTPIQQNVRRGRCAYVAGRVVVSLTACRTAGS